MPLELGHLEMSCNTLAELLEVSNDRDQMEQLSEVVEKGFRAGIVQYFELTRELAEKAIQEQLQLSEIVTNPKRISFACLMCEAKKAGLIHNPDAYTYYKFLRNKTTHYYNCELAEGAVADMPKFLKDVRLLIKELRRRNP